MLILPLFMNSFGKLLKLLVSETANIRKIYLLAILQGLFYIMIPLSIQAVVTYIMAGSFSFSLILLCSLTVMSVVFLGLFQLWQIRINETIQQSILVNIGVRFSHKLNNLKQNVRLNIFLSAKINHFFDTLTLQKGVSKILLDVSFSIVSIVFGLLVLSAYNPLFLVFTTATVIAFYIIIKVYGHRALEKSILESTNKYMFVDWLQNINSSLKNNAANFDEDFIIQETDRKLQNYLQEKSNYFKVLDVQFRSILIFKIIFISILLFLGVILVQTGYINIGQFVASEILVILVINAVEKLVINLKTVYDVLTATQKIFQVFELEEESGKNNNIVKFEALKNKLLENIYKHSYTKKVKRLLYGILICGGVILFLPWTQTVFCEGNVTTLDPTNRPQTITSRIAGRIEKWYIKEGVLVKKGDTIAFISEIKDDFMDPLLIDRSESQIKAKESSIESYELKINAINSQIDALNKSLRLKTEQLKNKIIQAGVKIKSDSAEMVAASNNYKVAEEQFKRFEELLNKGVISKTELENRKVKVQEMFSKKVAAENNYSNSINDYFNSEIELNSAKQDFNEKLMKAESDKLSSLSNLYESEAALTKMQNQLSNFSMRKSYYFVFAPQDGFISKTFVSGVGEIIKEGGSVCNIIPKQVEQAVELYVSPIDLPLIHKGQTMQLIFDGWPAFVFSGWPGISFGTYSAEIVAVDQAISPNGKFRILAVNREKEWPGAIQIGGGARGFALLNNVPVIYEMWRKINGFPPEFYTPEKQATK